MPEDHKRNVSNNHFMYAVNEVLTVEYNKAVKA